MKRLSILVLLAIALPVLAAAVIQFTGTISSIDGAAKTLVVADTTVFVTDSTIILKAGEAATFADLQVGQTVKVTGKSVSGGIQATRICIMGVCDGTGPKGRGGGGNCPNR